jgi:hypothetical protein
LAVCFVSFAPNLAGQTVAPKSKIQAAKQNEFVSEEGGFRAKFPAEPKKLVKQLDIGFGKADYTAFQHVAPTALHMIAYFDYPSALKDRTEVELLYDQMKELIVQKQPGVRVNSEQDVVWRDYVGRDYVIELNDFSLTMRCLIIEQRLFQVMVSTRGQLSKAAPASKKYHQKLVDDFFNSFAVTKLPDPQTSAVELPPDFGVKIDEENFRTDFFKFSMKLPSGWTALDKGEADYLKELGLQAIKEETPKDAKETEFSLQKTEMLLTMTKTDEKDAAVFMIAAEKMAFPNFSPAALTDNYLRLSLDPDEAVISKTALTKLGGVDFAWIETVNRKDRFKQRLYIANRGGIALQITFTYRQAAELQNIVKSLESLEFDEVKTSEK